MELTVQNVYGLLLRSKLLSLDDCRSMYARWQEEARDHATNLARFAAWMVEHKYLTEYQAGLLARGHADGFFINDYKVLDRLGKGRMAGVYKAQHTLGQVVAIKVLPPSKAKDAKLLARFQREARLGLRLRHPNIVRAFQMGVCGDLHYLVMEHLEGETLEEVLLRRKHLPPPEAVRLIYQALQGLQHIHEQGLVHRDLKPSNLMLVPAPKEHTLDCTLKILDIGLGRELDEGGEPPDSGLTSEGVLLGTPDYMAPEQARDPRCADIRSDIYSLGGVLYHLLAGQPPFPDTNIISQMIRHSTEAARPLKEFNPAVPDGLQHIVNWMMAKDPAGRYPTPERGAQALEVFLAAGSTPASSPDFDPDMQSYLLWLDKEGKPAAPPGPAHPAMVPTAPMVALPSEPPKSKPALPTSLVDPPSRSERRADRDSRRGKKKPPPPAVPAPDGGVVGVELVPLPAEKARAGKGLTRRDFCMFCLGVASGLAAYALGRLLAALIGRSRNADSSE